MWLVLFFKWNVLSVKKTGNRALKNPKRLKSWDKLNKATKVHWKNEKNTAYDVCFDIQPEKNRKNFVEKTTKTKKVLI